MMYSRSGTEKTMFVYYKFKSAKDFCSLPVDGPSISVANLKMRIFHSKRYGKGRDFDLTVMNAQTNEGWPFLQHSLSRKIKRCNY